MKTIFKTAAIAALITGFANSAQALEFTPITQAQDAVNLVETVSLNTPSFSGIFASSSAANYAPMTSRAAAVSPPNIAVARLHEGRFLPLPDQEAPAWAAINGPSAQFSALPASIHFEILAGVPLGAEESDNRIDEIRLAAAAAGQDYVLIYAVNRGASWGLLGDRDLEATGLTYDKASNAVRDGDAKALLVETYTGEVIGAVTTFAPDMKTLTKLVREMTSHVLDI